MPLRGKRATKTLAVSRKAENNDDKCEYEEILNSFLNLKQGKAEAYSELVEQVMSTTDNILKL